VGVYTDPMGLDGETTRTVTVTRSEDTTSGLTALLSAGGAPLVVPIEQGCCVDNFLLGIGDETRARFWRDEAGDVDAIQVLGDLGPPFYRVEE
jgi:hypothetical protein